MNVEKVEEVERGLKCCNAFIYKDHDNCPYKNLCDYNGIPKMLISDSLSVIRELKEEKQPKWISVDERLPENAQHKGALCPRYKVYTKWGETQGWYNPDKECWFILVWLLYDGLIDFKRGDKPCVYREMPGAKVVTHWMPLSEPPKEGGA